MKRKLLIRLASHVVVGIIVGIIVLNNCPCPPCPSPPEFEVSSLNISPEKVEPGDTVTVTGEVRNVGEEKGTHELELIIDGIVEQSECVTLDGGETTSISFFVEKDIESSYSVELAGVTEIFEVLEPVELLTVHFIDVGQGDSILLDVGDIEVLIDGGGKSPGVISYIDDYVDGSLEVMVATHPHADHIGGLIAVLDAFEVDEIWLNGDTSPSGTYSQFMLAVDSEDTRVFVARRGDTIQAGNLTFNVLHPVNLSDTINNNSIVLSLSYGQVDLLFTGDAEEEAEAAMFLASDIPVPDVEILKVGHHGSQSSSSIQFLQLAKPECAIYMAGEGNSYGHPHQETLTALTQVGAEIYGTDTCGNIVVTSDGKSFSVEPEKQCAPPPPEPARFDVSNLSISPREVKAGESVAISVDIANLGSSSGSYTAILKINSSQVETKTVTLNAGQSQVVSFTVVKESTGTYTVELGGLAGTFTVSPSVCTCYSYTLKRYIPCEQATAICTDGTCSISQSRSGTCSWHGGVARWIN